MKTWELVACAIISLIGLVVCAIVAFVIVPDPSGTKISERTADCGYLMGICGGAFCAFMFVAIKQDA